MSTKSYYWQKSKTYSRRKRNSQARGYTKEAEARKQKYWEILKNLSDLGRGGPL